MKPRHGPPGWPQELPPPESAEFAPRAVLWLLDNAPPEFRGHDVFRRQPLVLAWLVTEYLDGAIGALRTSYARVRAEFAAELEPTALDAVLRAVEIEGVRLGRVRREVDMVAQALAGRVWKPRL